MIIKTIYRLEKGDLKKYISIKNLGKIIFESKFRIQWDNSMKLYENYYQEGEILKCKGLLASPIFFISEREFITKRIEFIHKNTHYSFSSSIKEEENFISEDIVRMNIFINAMTITENESHYLFVGYNQFDPKFNLPDLILNLTIPENSVKWYRNLVNFINSTNCQ